MQFPNTLPILFLYSIVLVSVTINGNLQPAVAQDSVPLIENTHPNWAPNGDKIAFSSSVDGNYEIYAYNLRTLHLSQISKHPADDFYPVWSPDGSLIAYYSTREDTDDVEDQVFANAVISGNFGHKNAGRDSDLPSWAPNGRSIIFHEKDRYSYNIHITNRYGKHEQKITDNLFNELYPEYSPDGKKIVFTSDQTGYKEIFVMNKDGSNRIQLTDNEAMNLRPTWSPDGKHILFTSNKSVNFEIYSLNADGKNLRQLTHHPQYDLGPVWSPDGTQIAFVSDRAGNFDIYTMHADGSGMKQLTHDPSRDFYPSWSPDARRIAFTSSREGSTIDIFIMRADGTHTHKITGRMTAGLN